MILKKELIGQLWGAEEARRSWASRGTGPLEAQMCGDAMKNLQYLGLLLKAEILKEKLAEAEKDIRQGDMMASSGRAIHSWESIALGEAQSTRGFLAKAGAQRELDLVQMAIDAFDPAIKTEMDEKLKKLQATVGQ